MIPDPFAQPGGNDLPIYAKKGRENQYLLKFCVCSYILRFPVSVVVSVGFGNSCSALRKNHRSDKRRPR